MRWLVGQGLVVMVVAVYGGCESRADDRHRARDRGTLVVAKPAGVQALDPVRVTDGESIEVCELLFEGLVQWRPGTTDIAPGLATAWELSSDARTWTFHLRAKVVFHDGTPFDAGAVKFSFERLIDPKHPDFIAGKEGAYWRTLLKDVAKVVAIDPLTVEIHVARPYSPLLGDLAMFAMVSPTAVTLARDRFSQHPVGTGPFAFESWTAGEQVVVRRHDRYWGPRPQLDRIVFRVVVDARQRLVELESGSVDVATSILPDEQPFVELHPDLVLHHTPGNDVSYLAFNMDHPPFNDVRVRRAVNHAINKLPIVKLAYQGRAIAADGPLPPTQWGYHKPSRIHSYDLSLAKRLLAEATSAKAFDPDATYKLYALSTPRPYMSQPEMIARFLQAALSRVGIRTELVLQPYAAHRRSVEAGEHDLGLFGWVGDTGDPDNFLYVLFHSDNAQRGSATNIAFYRDATVDRLIREAQAAGDKATRSVLYAAAQDRIAEQVPWVPLAHSELVIVARTDVTEVILSPLGHPIYELIERAEAPGRP